MAKVDLILQNKAIALETKVDILGWIGLMPDQAAIMTKMQVIMMADALKDEMSPVSLEEGTHVINQMDLTMNDGIEIVMKKLTSRDCVECGKCDNLTSILQDLLDADKPIHEIQKKITEQFGDISNTLGAGLPGHQNPNIKAVHTSSAHNIIDSLLHRVLGGGGVPAGRSDADMDGIRNIIDKHFGETPAKDKLH